MSPKNREKRKADKKLLWIGVVEGCAISFSDSFCR
jgi:hypothetical protein